MSEHSSKFKLIDSMIPNILDDGTIECSNMAEVRAIRNGILFNFLNDSIELNNMMSLCNRILSLNNLELEKLLYDKLDYLGFTPKKLTLRLICHLEKRQYVFVEILCYFTMKEINKVF